MGEFDFGAVLRGDPLQEIEALRNAIGSALMTPNEGRVVLKLPTSDQDEMDRILPADQQPQPDRHSATAQIAMFGQPPPQAPGVPPADQNVQSLGNSRRSLRLSAAGRCT